MGRWEEIDHTADLALHIWAEDLEDLFITAARGMFALVSEPARDADATLSVPIELTAMDEETLLVDWLNELLYLYEIHQQAFRVFDNVAVTSTDLTAVAYGVPIASSLAYIKAATFHNLDVVVMPEGGYETEIVFDI